MNDALFLQFKDVVLNSRQATADEALVAADFFLEHGYPRLAASAFDIAFGHRPDDQAIRLQRTTLLDELAVEEHGLHWRYIPAGTFLMGSDAGEPDEKPVHEVRVDDFWITDIPVTWSAFCELYGYSPPPEGMPAEEPPRDQLFSLYEANKIRLQYCESDTLNARDWHAHVPDQQWTSGDGTISSEQLFGTVQRENPARPLQYDCKPMVAVPWQMATDLTAKLSTAGVAYCLPTEAQWEKAARGGLIGCRYSWGNESPSEAICDFDHFGDWVIRSPRSFPPNDYGLHGMCGGVWEWTQDFYDALTYRQQPGPGTSGQGLSRVLRGGSWSDCAETVTVSFRMSGGASRRRPGGNEHAVDDSPNVGFRMCRTVKLQPAR